VADEQRLILKFLGDASSAKRAASEVDGAVGKSAKGIMGVGSKVGVSLAAIGSAAVAMGVASVKAYAAAEVSAVRLEAAVNATGESYEALAEVLDSTVSDAMRKSAYDDEDLQDALATLTQTTGSTSTAMNDLAMVTDLARGRKMGLAAAAVMVAKIEAGNFIAARKMGIILGENATKEEYLAAIRQKYAGQAEAYANTLTGAMEGTEIAVENLKEAFGEGLVGDSAADINELSSALTRMEPAAKDAGEAIRGAGEAVFDFFYEIGAAWSNNEQVRLQWDAWAESGSAATTSFREFQDTIAEGDVFIAGSTQVVRGCQYATEDLAAATDEAAIEQDDLTRAMNGTMVAADELSGKERTLAELQNNASTAAFAAKDALTAYNEAVAEHGVESDEAQKAALRMEDANWAAGDAAADLTAKEQELGTTLAGIATQKQYEAWLAGIRDRAREAAAQIGSMYDASKRTFGTAGGSAGVPSGYKGITPNAEGAYNPGIPQVHLWGEDGPEYTIPTGAQYRPQALRLTRNLLSDLGVSGGGTQITWNGDVIASREDAPFVTAAVEQGFANVLAAQARPGM